MRHAKLLHHEVSASDEVLPIRVIALRLLAPPGGPIECRAGSEISRLEQAR
jgi:hypothetical protein